jgi:cytochrome c peroxidase
MVLLVGYATATLGRHSASAQLAPLLAPWEVENPIRPLPLGPLGSDLELAQLDPPPTPARVRLGRWLFYDVRLSADGSVACATCHQPVQAFSNLTSVATGIRGQRGRRKVPALINLATALYPHVFRDGRAPSLEAQALEPIANPAEMGNTHAAMLETLTRIPAYRAYFREAFGTPGVSTDRVARALADYERTRMSGNSPWDRWRRNRDEGAVSEEVKRGHALFFGRAGCQQCHLGRNFTDGSFHSLGVGWDPRSASFADDGRYAVTKVPQDRGAFKTPTLREVTTHPPYMHDGSVATLRDVMLLYSRGGEPNPYMDPKIRPLNLTERDIDALIAFLGALEGEGYADTPPVAFPQ